MTTSTLHLLLLFAIASLSAGLHGGVWGALTCLSFATYLLGNRFLDRAASGQKETETRLQALHLDVSRLKNKLGM